MLQNKHTLATKRLHTAASSAAIVWLQSKLGVRIVGTIIFGGSPPFVLAGVQAASADAAGEGVEMILDVKQPDIFPLPVQVRVSLSQKAAVAFATDLRLAALKVERNALKC